VMAQVGDHPNRMEIQTVGVIVDNLVAQFQPLIQEVLDAAQRARDVLEHQSRRLGSDLDISRHGMKGLKRSTNQATRRVTQSLGTILQLCTELESRAGQCDFHACAMAQAVQFDDITGQRLAHVRTLLDLVAQRLPQETDAAEAEERCRHGDWIDAALHLARAQMDDIASELDQAVSALHGSLIDVSDLIEQQTGNITALRQQSAQIRQQSAEIIYNLNAMGRMEVFDGDTVSEVLRTFSLAENALFQARRSLDILGTTATRLQTLLESIHPPAGSRLEVLVGCIHDLARRVHADGPHIESILNGATGMLGDLSSGFSEETTARLMRAYALLRRLPVSMQQMDDNNTDLGNLMNSMLGETRGTATQVQLLTSEINFHNHYRAELAGIFLLLEPVIRRHGEATAPPSPPSPELLPEFTDVEALYTMESERRIHRACFGLAPEEPATDDNAVELF
ncbi:MAG: hypothetical protein H7831_15885, partial [Magnetococcus sp. WYHC-3]